MMVNRIASIGLAVALTLAPLVAFGQTSQPALGVASRVGRAANRGRRRIERGPVKA